MSVNLKKKGLSKICTSNLFWCSQTPRCYACLNLTLLKYSFQCCRLGIYKMHWDSPWKWCQNWHQGPEWSNAFSLGGSRWTDWLRKVISIIWRQSGSSRQVPTLLPPPCCRTGKRGNAQYVTEWDWQRLSQHTWPQTADVASLRVVDWQPEGINKLQEVWPLLREITDTDLLVLLPDKRDDFNLRSLSSLHALFLKTV